MFYLNLLAPELKKEIKLKRLYSLSLRFNFIIIFTALFLAGIFLSAEFAMKSSFKNFLESPAAAAGNQNYSLKIKEINEKIAAISQVQNEFIPYSAIVKKLADKIPAGIKLSYVRIDTEKKSIDLRGEAQERQNLIALKESLESLPIFSEISYPLSNILQKEKINFEITAKLNLENLSEK